MGRGPRSSQAISLRAIPRLLRRPKKVGQRRYSAERIDPKGVSHREPGYIITIATDVTRYGCQMIVREEVAVEGKDGKLCWVKNQHRVYDSTYGTYNLVSQNPLSKARKLSNHLNKYPLGPIVTKEVNNQGQVEIGYGRRVVNSPSGNPYHYSDLTVINYEEPPKSFDIADPEQAKQAGELFDKLDKRKRLAEQEVVNMIMKSLSKSNDQDDIKLAEKISGDGEKNAEKINAAKRFSEALDKGDTKLIEKELAAKRKEKDAAGAKQSASRMKDTLRSLGGK